MKINTMTKRDHLEQGAEWGLYGSAWTHCPATKPRIRRRLAGRSDFNKLFTVHLAG